MYPYSYAVLYTALAHSSKNDAECLTESVSFLLDPSQYGQASCWAAEAPAVWGAARIRRLSFVEGGCQDPLYQGETNFCTLITCQEEHLPTALIWCESDRKINADGENEPVSRVYVQRENVERDIMG